MKLLEYEAKALLSKQKIAIPSFVLIRENTHVRVPFPSVLKSQVPVGGRGKAGGVKIVETQVELKSATRELFKLPIKGFMPKTILAEEKMEIAHEYYLSMLIDKPTATIQLMAHTKGGIEIENSSAEDRPLQLVVGAAMDGKNNFDAAGEQLAEYFDMPEQTFVLQDLAENLYTCFTSNDATLIEINPLIYTKDNKMVAGDCKMVLDDNAAFRHQWQFEEHLAEANFVTLNQHGAIATIANGAGLAMATVDAVNDAGMVPANFLDIGGGANTETLLKAFKRLGEYPFVKAIVINIFAGITRCDEVARAIIAAKKQIEDLPPLFIRLAGTNFEEAATMLADEQIPILATLEECLAAAKQEVSK